MSSYTMTSSLHITNTTVHVEQYLNVFTANIASCYQFLFSRPFIRITVASAAPTKENVSARLVDAVTVAKQTVSKQ